MIAEIRWALLDHQVIFFRDQHLTPEQHLAFGRGFGSLNVHEFVGAMADYPEIIANAIAFWDNRCVQHYAINDYHGQRRVMHRLTSTVTVLISQAVPLGAPFKPLVLKSARICLARAASPSLTVVGLADPGYIPRIRRNSWSSDCAACSGVISNTVPRNQSQAAKCADHVWHRDDPTVFAGPTRCEENANSTGPVFSDNQAAGISRERKLTPVDRTSVQTFWNYMTPLKCLAEYGRGAGVGILD